MPSGRCICTAAWPTWPPTRGDQSFIDAMDRLWDDVVGQKMYVTGGIGARHEGEAFGDRYELPNDSAYCETCAAIGLALWAHRLNLMHGDAQYADVLERVLYNGFLSGIAWTASTSSTSIRWPRTATTIASRSSRAPAARPTWCAFCLRCRATCTPRVASGIYRQPLRRRHGP